MCITSVFNVKILLLIDLSVGFSAPSFAGTEFSGSVQVNLDITGGIPSQIIRVDVIPHESSPISATGSVNANW